MPVFSYNGWEANPDRRAINTVNLTVNGIHFPSGVRAGDVETVLGYVAQAFNDRVERLYAPGCWGYAFRKNRNANNYSCHASATAIDVNAPSHPNGKANTFNFLQVQTIKQILSEVGGVVRWGGDFSGKKDEMHFEIVASSRAVAKVAARLRGGQVLTSSIPGPTRDVVLSPGDRGPNVAVLQTDLRWLGWDEVGVDGDFGPITEQAVRDIQWAAGLEVDGVKGPVTQKAMGAAGSWGPFPGNSFEGAVESPATKHYQLRLKHRGWPIKADGDHGPRTSDILRQFHAEFGMLGTREWMSHANRGTFLAMYAREIK